MADEITFDRSEMPEHFAWELVHVEHGTVIWARHVDLDTFAAENDLTDEERLDYVATSTDPSYQIELNLASEDAHGPQYGVTLSRSTGPDSSGVVTPDCRSNLDASAALTHVTYLLRTYA